MGTLAAQSANELFGGFWRRDFSHGGEQSGTP